MGRNEFFAWVDQLYHEKEAQNKPAESWDAAEHDPRWQSLRGKREKARGR